MELAEAVEACWSWLRLLGMQGCCGLLEMLGFQRLVRADKTAKVFGLLRLLRLDRAAETVEVF